MKKSRLIAVILIVLITIGVVHFSAKYFEQFGPIQGHTVPATDGPSALVRSLRPNYPYSIIPGGAFSPAELRYAHGKDDVVRAHYADFRVKQARMVVLEDDRYEFVSYRVKDQVYWTKRRLRIPKGELLLTDGQNFARARCGNRLSETPHATAVSRTEPDPKLLSLPPVNPDMLPKLALANPPALGDLPGGLPNLAEARTGAPAALTEPISSQSSAGTPIEVGQPVTGGGVIAGPPLLSSVGTANAFIAPANGSPPPTGSPVKPTPVQPPPVIPLPPVPVTPVPEPSNIYLFIVGLVVSGGAMLRMASK